MAKPELEKLSKQTVEARTLLQKLLQQASTRYMLNSDLKLPKFPSLKPTNFDIQPPKIEKYSKVYTELIKLLNAWVWLKKFSNFEELLKERKAEIESAPDRYKTAKEEYDAQVAEVQKNQQDNETTLVIYMAALNNIIAEINAIVFFEERYMSHSPVLFSHSTTLTEISIPATVVRVISGADVHEDIWAVNNEKILKEYSIKQKKVPTIVLKFSDYHKSHNSLALSAVYYGPKMNLIGEESNDEDDEEIDEQIDEQNLTRLVSGREILKSFHILENRRIKIASGRTIPTSSATLSQIIDHISDEISKKTNGRVIVKTQEIKLCLELLIQEEKKSKKGSHAYLEIEEFYKRCSRNELISAAFGNPAASMLLRSVFEKFLSVKGPEINTLIQAIETARIVDYAGFRTALYLLANGKKAAFKKLMEDFNFDDADKLLLEDETQTQTQTQTAEIPASTTRPQQAVALVSQAGASFLANFGFENIRSGKAVSWELVLKMVQINVLEGLFTDHQEFEKMLFDIGKTVADIQKEELGITKDVLDARLEAVQEIRAALKIKLNIKDAELNQLIESTTNEIFEDFKKIVKKDLGQ